jgi:hypothetical protein
MRISPGKDRGHVLLVIADSPFSAKDEPFNRANAFANRRRGTKI